MGRWRVGHRIVLAVLSSTLFTCNGPGGNTLPESGTVHLLLTTTEFEEEQNLRLTISSVSARFVPQGASEEIEVEPEMAPLSIETEALEQSFAELGSFQIPTGRLTQLRVLLNAAETRMEGGDASPVEIAADRNPLVLAVDVEVLKDTETQIILGFSVDGRLSLQGHGLLLSPKLVLLDASEIPVPRTRRPSCQGDCPTPVSGQSPAEDGSPLLRKEGQGEVDPDSFPSPWTGEGPGGGDRGPQIPAASSLPPLAKGGEGGFVGADGGTSSLPSPSMGEGEGGGGPNVDPDSDEVVHGALFACRSFELNGNGVVTGDVETNGSAEIEGKGLLNGDLLLNGEATLKQQGHAQITGAVRRVLLNRNCSPLDLNKIEQRLLRRNDNAKIQVAVSRPPNKSPGEKQPGKGNSSPSPLGGEVDDSTRRGGGEREDDRAIVPNPDGSLSIKLEDHEIIDLPAGDYFLESLKMEGQSALRVSGVARIYVKSGLEIEGHAQIVAADWRSFIKIIVRGLEVEIKGQANVTASVYAPNANVKLEGGSLLRGDIFALEVRIEGNAAVVEEKRIQNLFDGAVALGPHELWELIVRVGQFSLHEAEPAVTQIISDRASFDGITRLYAVQAAGHLSQSPLLDALLKVLRTDPDPEVRAAAAVALGRTGDPKLGPALVAAKNAETHPNVKAVIAKAAFAVTGNRTLDPRTRFDSINFRVEKSWESAPEPVPAPEALSEPGRVGTGRVVRDSFTGPAIDTNIWIAAPPPGGQLVQEAGYLKMVLRTQPGQLAVGSMLLREFAETPTAPKPGFDAQVQATVLPTSTPGTSAASFALTLRIEGAPSIRFLHFACGQPIAFAPDKFECVLTDTFFSGFKYAREVQDFRGSPITLRLKNDVSRKALVFSVPELEIKVDLPLQSGENVTSIGFQGVALPTAAPGFIEIHWDNFLLEIDPEIWADDFDDEGYEEDWTLTALGNGEAVQRDGVLTMSASGPASVAWLTTKRSVPTGESFTAQVKAKIDPKAFGWAGTFFVGLGFNPPNMVSLECHVNTTDLHPTVPPGSAVCTHSGFPLGFGRDPVEIRLGEYITFVLFYDAGTRTASFQIPEADYAFIGVPVTPEHGVKFSLIVSAGAITVSGNELGTMSVEWDDFQIRSATCEGVLPDLRLEDRAYAHEGGPFFLGPDGKFKAISDISGFTCGLQPLHAALLSVDRSPAERTEELMTVYTPFVFDGLKEALFRHNARGIVECFSGSILTPIGSGAEYEWHPHPCNREPTKRPPPLPDEVNAEDEGCLPTLCTPEETSG